MKTIQIIFLLVACGSAGSAYPWGGCVETNKPLFHRVNPVYCYTTDGSIIDMALLTLETAINSYGYNWSYISPVT